MRLLAYTAAIWGGSSAGLAVAAQSPEAFLVATAILSVLWFSVTWEIARERGW